MESPLTEDQISELNDIIKLPRDQQQKSLQPFLAKLTPEQINFLKESQQKVQRSRLAYIIGLAIVHFFMHRTKDCLINTRFQLS